MSSVKVAVTIDSDTLKRVDALVAKMVFPNRSRAVQAAVTEKLARLSAPASRPNAPSLIRHSGRRWPRKVTASSRFMATNRFMAHREKRRSVDGRQVWPRVAIILVLLLTGWHSARACSLMYTDEFLDGYVLYGEVTAHVESRYLGEPAWGIRIAPLHEFRIPERTEYGLYDIYPMDLASDCGSVPQSTRERLEQRFAIGDVVAVTGRGTSGTQYPGHIAPTAMGPLYRLEEECALSRLADLAHDFNERMVACSDYRFEANKEIALLETASPSKRVEILERLAHYQLPLSFIDLVHRYIPNAPDGLNLLSRRYGQMSLSDCLHSGPPAQERSLAESSVLAEYCRQRNPFDPHPGDDWKLDEAIRLNRVDIVQQYLDHGNDPNAPVRTFRFGFIDPLALSVFAQREEIALTLLMAGARLEASAIDASSLTRLGMTRALALTLDYHPQLLNESLGLSTACRHGHYDVVELVTQKLGQQQLIAGNQLDSALESCIFSGATDAAHLLLNSGVQWKDENLFSAARGASVGMVRALLMLGADPHARYTDFSETATRLNRAAAIDFALLDFDYKTESARAKVAYVLHELAAVGPAPRHGRPLDGLTRSVDAEIAALDNAQDRLLLASQIGVLDIVEDLLQSDIRLDGESLTAALHAALQSRHPDVARKLLAAGASPDGEALLIAVGAGQPGMVAKLLSLGADANAAADGATPLDVWYASEAADNESVLRLLLDAGADVCGFLVSEPASAKSLYTMRRMAPWCE